jgi:hypothetical protein
VPGIKVQKFLYTYFSLLSIKTKANKKRIRIYYTPPFSLRQASINLWFPSKSTGGTFRSL